MKNLQSLYHLIWSRSFNIKQNCQIRKYKFKNNLQQKPLEKKNRDVDFNRLIIIVQLKSRVQTNVSRFLAQLVMFVHNAALINCNA